MTWHHPFGTLDEGVPGPDGWSDWQVSVTDRLDGWRHTTLRVTTIADGGAAELVAPREELVVVPLAGSFRVTTWDAHGRDGARQEVALAGRPSVFSGPTDVLYVPRGRGLRITADGPGGRVAVCGAYVTDTGGRGASGRVPLEVTHVAAADVPVELRGAGPASRQVHNFGVPGVLDADRLIACEVLTPSGGWSSYPPHKHDEERPGEETELEEIYYFEVAPSPGSPTPAHADPVAYQRVYASGDRPIDVLAEVRTGDVVLVPHGWHGPAMAPPGHDLYYLNVMAGPGPERAWLIRDDPAHAWVRDTWPGQPVDPRLPFGGPR